MTHILSVRLRVREKYNIATKYIHVYIHIYILHIYTGTGEGIRVGKACKLYRVLVGKGGYSSYGRNERFATTETTLSPQTTWRTLYRGVWMGVSERVSVWEYMRCGVSVCRCLSVVSTWFTKYFRGCRASIPGG